MSTHLSPGARLGPYELLLPLPRTGAAQVWIARLVGAGGFRTHLALKTIPRAYFDDVPTEKLLLEQSALAAQIRHPNLVQALDLGEQDDTLYIAMEWIDGEPLQAVLSEALRKNGVPLPIAVNLVGQLCRGLHAIHEHRDAAGTPVGAVHGHLSPQNVLLAYNGSVKLCDFGIARAMDRLSFLSGVNQRNHKLSYAAPEQLSARPVDRRSDVFSAGTLLYVLTTSHHPFQGQDPRATLNNICSEQPALPPHSVIQDYPQPLRDIVLKALRKAPHERWGTALELLNALERAMPECFQSTCDQSLASFLDDICSDHKQELHSRIHAAESDRPAIPSSVPLRRSGSFNNSLRAVSMDQSLASASVPPSSRASASPPSAEFTRARLRHALPVAIAVFSTVLICVGLFREFAARPGGAPGSALASQPLPPEEPSVDYTSIPRVEATALALEEGSEAEETIGSAPDFRRSAAFARAPQAPRIVAPPRATDPSVARTAGDPSPPPQSSSSAGAASSAAGARVNAWDPSAFGGRH